MQIAFFDTNVRAEILTLSFNTDLNISMFLTSRTRGGPAHAAIVASSLFGTMSGSTVANVVGTGTFTIPLIKQKGFNCPEGL